MDLFKKHLISIILKGHQKKELTIKIASDEFINLVCNADINKQSV